MTILDFLGIMHDNNISNIIWLWGDCPLEDKYTLGLGGDEDYVIIYNRNEPMAERVADKIMICGENTAQIGNTDYNLCVTSHA